MITFPSIQGSQAGFGSVAVLIFFSVMSLALAGLVLRTDIYTKKAIRNDEETALQFIYDGILRVTTAGVEADLNVLRESETGKWGQCRIGNFDIAFRLRDHNTLIDLNNADPEILVAGFRALGFTEQRSAELAQRSSVYRGDDNPSDGDGANIYTKGAAFETVSELSDILEGDRNGFSLSEIFTTYNKFGSVRMDAFNNALKQFLPIDDTSDSSGETTILGSEAFDVTLVVQFKNSVEMPVTKYVFARDEKRDGGYYQTGVYRDFWDGKEFFTTIGEARCPKLLLPLTVP